MQPNPKDRGRRDFFKLTGGALGIAALSYFFGLRDREKPAPPGDGHPAYQDGGIGLPVFRGPYLQRETQLAAFAYKAELAALTELCDATLNSVEACPYRYVPLTSSLVLVYAGMLVSSLDARDAQIGSIAETELGFWVLTAAMQKTSEGSLPHHLAWHLPYLLVDEANSIATGREVYGFNKQAGDFERPRDIRAPRFSADVLGFKKFAPTALATKERLLEVDPGSAETPPTAWRDWNSARSAFSSELLKSIRPDLAGGIVEFAARAITEHVPLVFLKQLRHAADTGKAAYRSIVEAPIRIADFYEGGPLPAHYKLSIHDLESHPFIAKLGLRPEQMSTLGAWMKVNFVLDLGVEYPG